MTDILNREIKDRDFLLSMTIGRNSRGILFGIMYNGKLYWKENFWWNDLNDLDDNYSFKKSTPSNIYIIENPTEQELKFKNKIIKKIEEGLKFEQDEKEKIKAIQLLPKKECLEIGRIYIDNKGYQWVYMGYRNNKLYKDMREPAIFEKTGYCYECISSNIQNDKNINDFDLISSYRNDVNFDILKNYKRFASKTDKSIIVGDIIKNGIEGTYRNRTLISTIEENK